MHFTSIKRQHRLQEACVLDAFTNSAWIGGHRFNFPLLPPLWATHQIKNLNLLGSLFTSVIFTFHFLSEYEGQRLIISIYLICVCIDSFSHLNCISQWCRSLFVPYFKYLLDGCIHHLTTAGDAKPSGLTRKKKKAKIQEAGNMKEENSVLSLRNWHLRALVLSSLHKCFLYDTGSLKFFDSSNFQASQFLPYSLDNF